METQDRDIMVGISPVRERIKRNHLGQTFEDSTELIRQMREERSQYLADLSSRSIISS